MRAKRTTRTALLRPLCVVILVATFTRSWEGPGARWEPPVVLAGAGVTSQAKPGGGAGGRTSYEVKGGVTGLFPGSALPLFVKVENPYNFSISVRSIDVAVGNASSDCGAANVGVDRLAAPVVVPAGGEAVTSLTIRMRNDPPDSCRLATFPLTFTSRAVKA